MLGQTSSLTLPRRQVAACSTCSRSPQISLPRGLVSVQHALPTRAEVKPFPASVYSQGQATWWKAAQPGWTAGRDRIITASSSAGAAGGGSKGHESHNDTNGYPPGFVQRRLLAFIGILLGYTGLYFTRGSITYAAPTMVNDPSLHFTLKNVGAMTSAFPFAYGISKFVGGVLGASFSPTWMLAGGLMATALINMSITIPGVGLGAMTGLWALNGCLQGIGAPASSVLLTRWFASKERGTYWGLWNIGANLGGFLTPILVGAVSKQHGWRAGMTAAALVGVVFSMLSFATVRDSPEKAGYPPVEAGPGNGAKEKPDIWKALTRVLAEPGIWLLAIAYFFVYVVRQAATSWLVFYLLQVKGAPDAGAAAKLVSGLELGGLVGGMLAGFVSDWRVRRAMAANSNEGYVGQRVQIVLGYLLATFGVIAALKAVPPEAKALQWATIAALGFCIYGPQMLIGLCGAELVDKTGVGASQGVLGLISYMGAANAGVPLAHVVNTYGWNGYFVAMTSATLMALLLLLPLANAKAYIQKNKQPQAS